VICEKLRVKSRSQSLLEASQILWHQLLTWWLPVGFVVSSALSSQPYLYFSFFGLCSVPSAKHKPILTFSVTVHSVVASFECPDKAAVISGLKVYLTFHTHKYPCSSQTTSRPAVIG